MKNWKTTLGGVLGATGLVLSGILTAFGVPAAVGVPLGSAIAAIGHILTGTAAQDANQ